MYHRRSPRRSATAKLVRAIASGRQRPADRRHGESGAGIGSCSVSISASRSDFSPDAWLRDHGNVLADQAGRCRRRAMRYPGPAQNRRSSSKSLSEMSRPRARRCRQRGAWQDPHHESVDVVGGQFIGDLAGAFPASRAAALPRTLDHAPARMCQSYAACQSAAASRCSAISAA